MTTQNVPTLIAIDVAKEKLDCYNTATKKYEVIKNDARSIGAWLSKTLKAFTVEKVILEPTGGYEEKVLLQLDKKNIEAFFVHPSKVHYFKKGKGENAKTDIIDAFHIAEYAIANEGELKPANKEYLEEKIMQELVRARRQILQEIHRFLPL